MDVEWYYNLFRALSLVVVWAIPVFLVAAVVVFAIGAPVLTSGGLLIRLYDSVRPTLRTRVQPEAPASTLACSVDADCPTGFVCADGHCVPATPR